ncbi:hypothetical protein GSI_02626 [Ganoderma sinense ZZ0214-1]|uniref:Uncharacterized protein n=1 Tax=Ganoderma sinense ZZ0214-1 TaxID=1077348 RepID=A0A2G8SM67_9APHY|nr:hypothetical protein GSI_02626 [Ganoderma sinense ZZ0214-1]
MADVPTASQSQSRSQPKPSRPRPAWVDLPPNPEPTRAFGFVLDHQCRLRWAHYFLNELEKDEGTFTPEERAEMLDALEVVIMDALPSHIYHALPDVPRVRPDLLPVAHKTLGDFDDYVFALRDNSTHKRLHAPLTKEHIEAIRKALGLPDGQQPKWVRMPVYVRELFV